MTDYVGDFTTTAQRGADSEEDYPERSSQYTEHVIEPHAVTLPATAHDRLTVSIDDSSVVIDVTATDGRTAGGGASASPAKRRAGWTALHDVAKRVFDVAFATVVLAVTLPVFLLMIVAIRVSSPGPAFFRHERRGRYGVPFPCWKFRTMHVDADQRLSTLLARDAKLRDEFLTTQKLREDPRVTTIGRVLRRTSLDELPQLLNVLSGDMSIVGPRPIVDDEVPMYGRSMAAVESVRPGMTGLWQVSGRNDLPYDVRVRLDEHYSTTHSLWFDLKIVCRTISVVFRGQGAY